MSDFRISVMQNSSVLFLYSERDAIQLDPDYQRMSDVWNIDKRRFLVDSVLNGYDIPKIYFHEFQKPLEKDGQKYRYAIIDGKQRLQSLWQFIDGQITLADDFEYLHDFSIKAAGMTYNELSNKYPKLKIRFDSTTLTVVTIQTSDEDLIEDMFSRLNEAAPLNASEKRNAYPGPLPPVIRNLAQHLFFKQKIPFGNNRYKHFDLVTKFLYLEAENGPTETKKVYLDSFVKNYPMTIAKPHKPEVDQLVARTTKVLDALSSVFADSDRLLRSSGLISVYYLLARNATINGWLSDFTRTPFQEFESLRYANRVLAEQDIAKARYDLLEFDKLVWSLNDASAIDFCYQLLLQHFGKLNFYGMRNWAQDGI